MLDGFLRLLFRPLEKSNYLRNRVIFLLIGVEVMSMKSFEVVDDWTLVIRVTGFHFYNHHNFIRVFSITKSMRLF